MAVPSFDRIFFMARLLLYMHVERAGPESTASSSVRPA
jgi:hypothetical protein